MKRVALLLIGLALVCLRADAAEVFELNTATLDQLHTLPITDAQADIIWQHLLYEGPFESIYEVGDLPGFDAQTLAALRERIRVNSPRPVDARIERIEDAYYRIETLGTEEGTNVGLVDEWIDRLMEPLNVNEASLDELMDLQNVSPADAVAIYQGVQRQGGIRGARDLRAVPGLSDWGYRNARNYLGYDSTRHANRLHGTYTFRAYNTPFFADEELAIDPSALIDPRPDVSHKLRMTYGTVKGGVLWHRNLGEETFSASGTANIPELKWFAGIEKRRLGPIQFDRTYIGSYQVSFGQGLVMESGDYFSPRYSGFGFDKRITGVAPDLSRAQELTMRGAATEARYGKFKAVGFFSADKKDAVLNPDGSLNRLITLVPRTDQDIYPSYQKLENGDTVFVPAYAGRQSMLNAVTEVGLGGELAFRPWAGASLGFAATQFMYNKPLKPDLGQTYRFDAKTRSGADTAVELYAVIDPQERDEIADNDLNSEIRTAYRSTGTSSLWSGANSVRRIYGFSLMSVLNNYTFQAEYGEMDNGGGFLKQGDEPHALVTSLHAQWNSLTALAVYRDYSIDYDNPYCRGFSNYARYNGSTYEDEFYLAQPVFAQLERNAAGPQAERGVYFFDSLSGFAASDR